jgi:hypothetical protein
MLWRLKSREKLEKQISSCWNNNLVISDILGAKIRKILVISKKNSYFAG